MYIFLQQIVFTIRDVAKVFARIYMHRNTYIYILHTFALI